MFSNRFLRSFRAVIWYNCTGCINICTVLLTLKLTPCFKVSRNYGRCWTRLCGHARGRIIKIKLTPRPIFLSNSANSKGLLHQRLVEQCIKIADGSSSQYSIPSQTIFVGRPGWIFMMLERKSCFELKDTNWPAHLHFARSTNFMSQTRSWHCNSDAIANPPIVDDGSISDIVIVQMVLRSPWQQYGWPVHRSVRQSIFGLTRFETRFTIISSLTIKPEAENFNR